MDKKQILFNIDQVRREVRSGGEVIKALEIFERTVREEPEPLAVVEGGWLDSVAGLRPYLFLADKGCAFGTNADDGAMPKACRPVTVKVYARKPHDA